MTNPSKRHEDLRSYYQFSLEFVFVADFCQNLAFSHLQPYFPNRACVCGGAPNFKAFQMTNRICKVAGCHSPAKGTYSAMCVAHTKTNARHGDHDQRTLTKGMLKPFKARVEERWIKRNSNLKWDAVERRWEIVVEQARGIIAAFEAGRPDVGWRRDAARAVIQLADDVPAHEIVLTVCAVYLHARANPRFYVTDRGFQFQLVRALRKLTRTNAGEYWDHQSGKTKLVYRDLNQRAVEYVAAWVVEALGPVGVHLQKAEDREDEKALEERRAFANVLGGIE
jgi:hypothetical protein